MAINRSDGSTAWKRTARKEVPHQGKQPNNSFASASAIVDGTHVIAYFGSRGLYCYDLEGRLVWEKDLGDMQTRNGFGEGASPALSGDTLVVNWDHEGQDFVVALDKKTGKELWRRDRDEPTTWTTPLIVEHAGRRQVVTAGTNRVKSYDLQTGELVWEAPGLTPNAIPTPIESAGIVYVTSGYRGSAARAIRLAGAKGDLTGTPAILWETDRDTPYVPSPLLYQGVFYLVKSPPPLRDEKILAAWNGLMIGAFARAAVALGEPRYAAQAARAADFVLARMRVRGRLLRSYSEGRARHNAYLEDYAFLISGLLDLYEATGRPRWLGEAIALDQVLERHYEDQSNGGYFTTSDDHERLLTRAKPAQDGAEPSGNSVQALNLLRLHELTDDDRYRRRAERTLAAFSGRLAQAPEALSELLLAGDFHTDTPKQVVIVTPRGRAQAEPLLAKLRAAFVPNRVLVVAAQGQDLAEQARLVPLLEGKVARRGKATAYVCERRVCERPTSDPEVFAAQIAKIEPLGKTSTPQDKALAYLMQEVPAWRQKHACGSCHNNGDAARALFRARDLGYAVPQQAIANTLEWLRQPLEWERAPGEPGTSDIKLARVQFTAALLGAVESNAIEDRRLLLDAARKLASDQDADGAWRIAAQASLGSPAACGPFVATWLARRTLAAADPGGFANEIARADAWLIANPAKNVMDAAAAMLALADSRTDAAHACRREALELLLGAQTSDGGWGPYPRSPPEAFDTALALLALAQTGGAAHREPIRKGREYLVRTQLETGGWKETTRPSGYQSYAQHISTTAWATLALLETGDR